MLGLRAILKQSLVHNNIENIAKKHQTHISHS